jgi:hypothetical protein
MASIIRSKLLAFMLVSAVLMALAVPMAFASEETTTAHAVPDISVIVGATGSGVGKASVYLDGALAGTTDSKGNFTFKEAPAAGNHTILVSGKGINNSTVQTAFAEKPVVIKVDTSKGKSLEVLISDRTSKKGLAEASIYNGKYLMGTTDVNGNFKIANFPTGIYLVKLEKEGYRTSTTLLIVFADRKQSFGLSPAAAHE